MARGQGVHSDTPLHQFSLQLSMVAIQLGSCAREIRDEMNRQLATDSLVEIDFVVLCLVMAESDQRLSQTELAVRLPLSPARISRTVDHLRGSGLLNVERDAQDRRRQFVCLTEAGNQQLQQTLHRLSPLLNSLIERFPQHDLADWVRQVIQLRDAILTPSAAADGDLDHSSGRLSASTPRKGAA